MPVEIREVHITMNLLDSEPYDSLRDEQEQSSGSFRDERNHQALLDECVEAVLRILKDREEP